LKRRGGIEGITGTVITGIAIIGIAITGTAVIGIPIGIAAITGIGIIGNPLYARPDKTEKPAQAAGFSYIHRNRETARQLISSPINQRGAAVDGLSGGGDAVPIVKNQPRRDRHRCAAAFFAPNENPGGTAFPPRVNRQDGNTSSAPTQAFEDDRQGVRAMDQDDQATRRNQCQRRRDPGG
jgi:hypothetical protein